MRYFLMSFGVLFLFGCKTSSLGSDGLETACTMIAAANSIQLEFRTLHSYPQYLAIAVNGEELDYDECDMEASSPFYVVDRPGVLEVRIESYSNDFQSYFESWNSDPSSDIISIKIWGRKSCSDPLQLIEEYGGLYLNWTKSYPNGPKCLHDGYSAEASVIIME